MAQNTKKKKNIKAMAIATVLAAALFVLIFHPHTLAGFVIMAAVLFAVWWAVGVMSLGLDTSKSAPAQKPIEKTGNEAVDTLIENGYDLLGQIRDENAQIAEPVLSEKIDRLNDVADRIFRTVADQPKKAPQIRRFMNYYLPTTLKMLNGFRRMEEQNVQGENADATRKQIQSAMDVVLKAFDKQLDAMYADDMLDISTDIEVMETLLHQDGLLPREKAQENQTQTVTANGTDN